MKKKVLLLTLILLIVVLAAAAVLYPRLSASMQPRQMATTPPATTEATQPATEAAAEIPETTAATEPTEPEPVAVPDFPALDWEGNEVKFSDYAGKPIVLNFWAHWCGPCQREMPEFNAVYEELGGEVTFLMVHVGADVESGKETVTGGGYTFPVVFDVDGMAGAIYGITVYPTTFFVDADGNLRAYYMGAMNADMLQQGIDLIYTAE